MSDTSSTNKRNGLVITNSNNQKKKSLKIIQDENRLTINLIDNTNATNAYRLKKSITLPKVVNLEYRVLILCINNNEILIQVARLDSPIN